MDKSVSTPGPDTSILAVAVILDQHAALLENPGKFDLSRRKAGLLDKWVAAVFGFGSAKAELLALCFQIRNFAPAETVNRLAERNIVRFLYVPNSCGAVRPRGEQA